MLIYPAINLIDGKAVRLFQGDYDQMTVFGDDPTLIARDFADKGAQRIHLVDLMGAKSSSMPAFDVACAIKDASGLFCEIGGGIRTMDAIARYLDAGIDRAILGTAAAKDPAFAREAVEAYGERIAIGIDVRDGMVATQGWTELSEYSLERFVEVMREIGVATIICTDISKDGAMQGTNLEMYAKLSEIFDGDIVASGGVSTLADVEALAALGLHGAIIGKAYYTGAIDLAQAIEIASR